MNYQYLSLVILVLLACTPTQIVSEQVIKDEPKKYLKDQPAKFEPPIGKVLVFTGQDNESIGGISPYNNGYVDHFPVPAGVTLYTGIGGNDGSFGGKNSQGLQGIYETMDPGNGPSNMSLLMEAKKFEKSALAIGFSMVNNEEKVAAGELDDNIKKLGEFLLSLGERPVFLRIGYEFDGHPWNHYLCQKEKETCFYSRVFCDHI